MDRSDGTVAPGDAEPVPPPPHAVTKSPTTARAGNNLANFMRIPLRSKFPSPSSRALFGARVRRRQDLLRRLGCQAEHYARPWVCQVFGCNPGFRVRGLDKPPQSAMLAPAGL